MNDQVGKLLSIAVRPASRAEMQTLDVAETSTEKGVADDFRGAPGPRQVTVLNKQDWDETCRQLGCELSWTTRRANLLVDGLVLENTAGGVLTIGEVEMRITGETDPCNRMEEQHPGLFQALLPHWRGGVCCQVISGGVVRIGDKVALRS